MYDVDSQKEKIADGVTSPHLVLIGVLHLAALAVAQALLFAQRFRGRSRRGSVAAANRLCTFSVTERKSGGGGGNKQLNTSNKKNKSQG